MGIAGCLGSDAARTRCRLSQPRDGRAGSRCTERYEALGVGRDAGGVCAEYRANRALPYGSGDFGVRLLLRDLPDLHPVFSRPLDHQHCCPWYDRLPDVRLSAGRRDTGTHTVPDLILDLGHILPAKSGVGVPDTRCGVLSRGPGPAGSRAPPRRVGTSQSTGSSGIDLHYGDDNRGMAWLCPCDLVGLQQAS